MNVEEIAKLINDSNLSVEDAKQLQLLISNKKNNLPNSFKYLGSVFKLTNYSDYSKYSGKICGIVFETYSNGCDYNYWIGGIVNKPTPKEVINCLVNNKIDICKQNIIDDQETIPFLEKEINKNTKLVKDLELILNKHK